MITENRTIPCEFIVDGIDKKYDETFALICQNIQIKLLEKRFVYFIDENYVMDTTKGYRYENLTPAYNKILLSGLQQLKYIEESNDFCVSYNLVLDNLILLSKRIVSELQQCDFDTAKQVEWFENLQDKPADSFEEAIQRMLFINQIFWQTDHRLTGLGAWDSLLESYYKKDTETGKLTRTDVLQIIKDIFKILHENYEYKSNVLMGDTGQIFVLGKSNISGDYICNDLTYLFIEAMKELMLPEPKCLLRVNKNTPRKLIELALQSIVTGIGAPLFANDDIVIPKLIEFGIEPQDAYEYTASACWEPLIGGKSTSLNNMTVLNYLKALDNLLKRENLDKIHNFDELVECYLGYLRRNLKAIKRVLSPLRFQYNPLLSVFTEGCFETKKDVSWGGAYYHHIGITSVAMGNLIDSLLNIKEFVFDNKCLTLYDIKQMLILNFEGNETLRERLQKKYSVFATDQEDIIDLVNRITACVSEELKDFRSYLGGKIKVGLSGSAYLDAAKKFGASFDGRKTGEPFTVHISNEDNHGFTEIINFAARLNYGNSRFNGNVVDLMVSPDFINNNWGKFVDFLILSIKNGFFELQMNVVSSASLIEARKNPDKFPNLIVRVWGFSAYFNDLPDEYKDLLIERLLRSEKKVS